MNIFKQILKNTSAGWFEMLILFISGMAITPILIKYFGKEGYGVWLLVAQMVGYLSILDLGVSNSLGRFVAKYIALIVIIAGLVGCLWCCHNYNEVISFQAHIMLHSKLLKPNNQGKVNL